ncbi:MAG: type II toxin-antitoxin system VapB family antitoxin [Candidatus Asgardarchaeia archaeon]
MSVVSIRVPKKLKEEMKKVNINWSKYLRSVIEEKIRRIRMEEASRKIDEIRNKTIMGVFNAARSIREDRDKR